MHGRWMFSPTQPPPKKSQTVFKRFYHFIFQSAVYESSVSSISLSTLGIINLFILAILDEYVVVSYCSFICISLMINDIKHLLMFSLVICIFSFINFKYLALLLFFFLILLCLIARIFIYSRFKYFVRYMYYEYFLPVCDLLF